MGVVTPTHRDDKEARLATRASDREMFGKKASSSMVIIYYCCAIVRSYSSLSMYYLELHRYNPQEDRTHRLDKDDSTGTYHTIIS